MKDIIEDLYNIRIENLFVDEVEKYYFYINKKKYSVIYIENMNFINNKLVLSTFLLNNNVYSDRVIINKFHSIVSFINHNNFVLLERKISSKSLLDKILEFSSFKLMSRQFISWSNIWLKKLENISNDMNFSNDVLMNFCNDFYLYLGKISILMFSKLKEEDFKMIKQSINHVILDDEDFYNPFNYIIDYFIRDFAEYFRKKLYNNNFNYDDLIYVFKNNNLKINEITLFLSRVLYPKEFINDFVNNKEKLIDYYKKIDYIYFELNNILRNTCNNNFL